MTNRATALPKLPGVLAAAPFYYGWVMMGLAALALSTWVFSSVPESWPFSATLVILVLLLLRRAPVNAALTGAALGVAMLNNVFLDALWVPAAVALARAGGGGRRIAR